MVNYAEDELLLVDVCNSVCLGLKEVLDLALLVHFHLFGRHLFQWQFFLDVVLDLVRSLTLAALRNWNFFLVAFIRLHLFVFDFLLDWSDLFTENRLVEKLGCDADIVLVDCLAHSKLCVSRRQSDKGFKSTNSHGNGNLVLIVASDFFTQLTVDTSCGIHSVISKLWGGKGLDERNVLL